MDFLRRWRKILAFMLLAGGFCVTWSSTNPVAHTLSVNPLKRNGTTSPIKRRVLIFCQSGWLLQIAADGTVNGTLNPNSEYVKLEIQSLGIGLVSMEGIKTSRYLAMNKYGTLISSQYLTDEAVFKEDDTLPSYFFAFASFKYYRTTLYDTYIAIKKNGKARNGHTSSKHQRSTSFLTTQLV